MDLDGHNEVCAGLIFQSEVTWKPVNKLWLSKRNPYLLFCFEKLVCFSYFKNIEFLSLRDWFFGFLSWVRWSWSLWWMKGDGLIYLGRIFVLFVLCFQGFFPLWEELAWCCSAEKKNLWTGCKFCFSEEVANRIVWTQKHLELIIVAILLIPKILDVKY